MVQPRLQDGRESGRRVDEVRELIEHEEKALARDFVGDVREQALPVRKSYSLQKCGVRKPLADGSTEIRELLGLGSARRLVVESAGCLREAREHETLPDAATPE